MNESIKTFSLVVITICVFIMTVIDIMDMIEKKNSQAVPVVTTYHNQPAPPPSTDVNQPRTTVEFPEKSYDFGKLTSGDVVHHTFAFTNTGKSPLLITNAIGSCGCTVPTYPKTPIPPGGRDVIEVQFNSSGKSGLQNKTVTVSANTEQPTVLTISADVKEKE